MAKTRTISTLSLIFLANFALEIILLFINFPLVLLLDACGLLFGFLLLWKTAKEFRPANSSFLSLVVSIITSGGRGLPELAASLCFIIPGLILDLLGCCLLIPSLRHRLISEATHSAPPREEPNIPASQMTIDVKPINVRDANPAE